MPSAGYKPFYSFPINVPFLEDMGGGAVIELQRPLELGVGESGVVGRRVSIVTGPGAGAERVAEGIIGWN